MSRNLHSILAVIRSSHVDVPLHAGHETVRIKAKGARITPYFSYATGQSVKVSTINPNGTGPGVSNASVIPKPANAVGPCFPELLSSVNSAIDNGRIIIYLLLSMFSYFRFTRTLRVATNCADSAPVSMISAVMYFAPQICSPRYEVWSTPIVHPRNVGSSVASRFSGEICRLSNISTPRSCSDVPGIDSNVGHSFIRAITHTRVRIFVKTTIRKFIKHRSHSEYPVIKLFSSILARGSCDLK
ncbi:hypothetical protein B0H13DRAFT_1887852 [Mycena leptocephala]|nr:hypothetical protein B0H13DRAFT_1887852 [Mycena leptocephala]